jgi:protein involved in polysaccharide export with SLBB domain
MKDEELSPKSVPIKGEGPFSLNNVSASVHSKPNNLIFVFVSAEIKRPGQVNRFLRNLFE